VGAGCNPVKLRVWDLINIRPGLVTIRSAVEPAVSRQQNLIGTEVSYGVFVGMYLILPPFRRGHRPVVTTIESGVKIDPKKAYFVLIERTYPNFGKIPSKATKRSFVDAGGIYFREILSSVY